MAQPAQLTQVTQGDLGNTKTKSPPPSKSTRSRKWCFTLNNYTDEEYDTLTQRFINKGWKYIIGKEVGEDKKTPHLQGYVETKSAVAFKTIKDFCNRLHLEKAMGSTKQNYTYCSKENNYVTNITVKLTDEEYEAKRYQDILKKEYGDVKWRPWQQEIITILDGEPSNRLVHWRWEATGNVGKSYLCKYLALTRDVIICSGKRADVLHQVSEAIKKRRDPKIILLDVPRQAMDYINYGTIEEIQNGCFYSGKYEGGTVVMSKPHVIAFANTPPDYSSMSEDRWDVKEIIP